MGRKLCTTLPPTLPQTTIHLIPEWPFLKEFKRQNKAFKDKQETQYNLAHRTRPLPPLEGGMDVWVSSGDRKIPGQVVAPSHTPSSYLVDTPLGQLRRNRHHLIAIRNQSSDLNQDDGTGGTGSKDQPEPGSQEVHAQSTPLDESHTVTSNDNQEDRSCPVPPAQPPLSTIQTRSRTGTTIRPPSRFRVEGVVMW